MSVFVDGMEGEHYWPHDYNYSHYGYANYDFQNSYCGQNTAVVKSEPVLEKQETSILERALTGNDISVSLKDFNGFAKEEYKPYNQQYKETSSLKNQQEFNRQFQQASILDPNETSKTGYQASLSFRPQANCDAYSPLQGWPSVTPPNRAAEDNNNGSPPKSMKSQKISQPTVRDPTNIYPWMKSSGHSGNYPR